MHIGQVFEDFRTAIAFFAANHLHRRPRRDRDSENRHTFDGAGDWSKPNRAARVRATGGLLARDDDAVSDRSRAKWRSSPDGAANRSNRSKPLSGSGLPSFAQYPRRHTRGGRLRRPRIKFFAPAKPSETFARLEFGVESNSASGSAVDSDAIPSGLCMKNPSPGHARNLRRGRSGPPARLSSEPLIEPKWRGFPFDSSGLQIPLDLAVRERRRPQPRASGRRPGELRCGVEPQTDCVLAYCNCAQALVELERPLRRSRVAARRSGSARAVSTLSSPERVARAQCRRKLQSRR